MTRLVLIYFLLFTRVCSATNYYVSSAGSDAANGLTTLTSWQNISKVNSFTFGSGDSILFKRGDTFYGGLVVKRDNLNFGAYGTGTKPIITGLTTVTGWVNLGGNIWEAPTTGVSADVNIILRDGIIQQVGRYPNANAANGGYLTLTGATATSLTGPALSSVTNWTGSEVAVRWARWEIRRRTVTSHSGGTINFADIDDVPKTNFGYFFQRDSRTLDADGEWYQNGSTNKLRMYFGNNDPSSYVIQAAMVDTLFDNPRTNITISNIAFNGANKIAISADAGTWFSVSSCDVNNCGNDGIAAWFCKDVTVDNCTTKNCLASGIRVRSTATAVAVNILISNCTVDSTSLIAGMEANQISGAGIYAFGGIGVSVLNNTVTNSGYNGIGWQGDNVLIKNNFVRYFCSVRDDGGGIYTYEGAGVVSTVRSNRRITGNIILNGIGARYGAYVSSGAPADLLAALSANGIYLDEATKTVIIDSNTIANIPYQGLQGNGNNDITIRYNTIFNASISHAFQRLNKEIPMTGFVITNNIFYPFRFRFRDQASDKPTPVSQVADVQRLGISDSNYYSTTTGADTSIFLQTADSVGGNFSQIYRNFSYLVGTVSNETHSINVVNTGTLEYNASSVPKLVSFPGLSNKDAAGNVFNHSVTIPAWSSKILIANGSIGVVPTPDGTMTKYRKTVFISQ